MQKDTRRMTVARDHLQAAREEVSLAMGHSERSIAEAAARRAQDHLDLAMRRIVEERAVAARKAHEPAIEEAFRRTELAWHGVAAVLEDWEQRGRLDAVHEDLLAALEALERACELAREEKVHA